MTELNATVIYRLGEHVGHAVGIVTYGDPVVNVSLECEDCNELLMDYEIEGN